MPMPRWFDAHLIEAREGNHPVDYEHLGEQMGLRIEEAVSTQGLKQWWPLAREWTDGEKIESGELGETEKKILSFLERECPECMEKIPADERVNFLKGLWKKKSS